MNIKPTADNLVVIPIEPETETETGIALPQDRAEQISLGRVWALGPDISGVNIDDVVLYAGYAGQEYKLISGATFLILKWRDVVGVQYD